MEKHNFSTEKSDPIQVIANEPVKQIIDRNLVFFRITLFLVLITTFCNLITNLYTFLHNCMLENILWSMMSWEPSTVVKCATETTVWLPFILRHLIK